MSFMPSPLISPAEATDAPNSDPVCGPILDQ